MIESLPQNESRRRSGLILSISSGYAWMKIGTPASCSAATAPFSSPKLGRREDHAIEFAPVLRQEGGELCRFLDRFDRAVAGGVLVQRDHFMAQAVQRADQLGARAGDEGGGEESPVAQEEGKGGFGFGHAIVSY